jgi:pentatricopeptide repeat protein
MDRLVAPVIVEGEEEPHQPRHRHHPLQGLDVGLAFQFLDRLVELERSTDNITTPWTTNCLNPVLQLWHESCCIRHPHDNDNDDSGGGASSTPVLLLSPQAVLAKIDDYRAQSSVLIPDVQSYNILLDGAGRLHEMDVCTNLWNWMWKESQTDNLIQPDLVTVRTLIKAWSKSGRRDAAAHAEALVDEWMHYTTTTPTTTTPGNNNNNTQGLGNALIHVWAKEDPRQAQAYLQNMAQRHLEHPEQHEAPDTLAWNRVISAYAIRHGQPAQAAALLEDFWEFADAHSFDHKIYPDLFSYNAVLEGWSRVGNAVEANKTWTRLQMGGGTAQSTLTLPNIMSYTSVIKANGGDLERVDELAQECLQAYQDQEQSSWSSSDQETTSTSPNILVLDHGFFHAWLNACVQAGGRVDRSTAILQLMKEQFDMVPDTTCYRMLLQCFLEHDDDLEGATKWLLDHAKEMDEPAIVLWAEQLLQMGDISILSFFNKFFGGGKQATTSLLQILCEQDYLKEPASMERLVSRLSSEQGLQVLQWMKAPTRNCYALVIRALAKEVNGQGAEDLLTQWQEQRHSDESVIDGEMYTSVIAAWSKTGNLERTKHWFDQWLQNPDLEDAPSPIAQTAVLSCCSQATEPNIAEGFLNELKQLYSVGTLESEPDVVMHNIVLKAWARVANGKRAEQFLESMEERDVISYNTVVQAYVKERKLDQALEFVQKKIEDESYQPDLATFRSILTGWAKSRDSNAAERAEEVLDWTKDLHQQGVLSDPPDHHCYQLVLDAWTKSKLSHAGDRAEAMLSEMRGAGTKITSSAYLKAMKSKPKRAESLLHEMYGSYMQGKKELKPTAEAFWVVLQGLARSRSPERADNLLRQMKDLYQSGRLDTAKPTRQAYTVVMRSWAKSEHARAGDRAESLLREMQSQYLDDGDTSAQPTVESYKWVLAAMSKTKPVAHVEALFQELFGAYCTTNKQQHNLQPDTACFNAILVACRSAKEADKAQSFLSQIEEWNDTGVLDTKPTVITYNLVLACMASRGLALQAEDMLEHMVLRGIRPDAISYNTIMNAWANSKQVDAVPRVESLLARMKLPPDAITFSTLLRTVAVSQLSDKADRGREVVDRMKQQGFEPNERDLKQLDYALGRENK